MLASKQELCDLTEVVHLQKYMLPESQAEFPLTTLNINHCDLYSQWLVQKVITDITCAFLPKIWSRTYCHMVQKLFPLYLLT